MKALIRSESKLPKLLFLALFLALAPVALASTTWYVDGVNGNDNNDCKTEQTACQTIGHAISLCSPWDSIMLAPATYTENLTINISLKIIGSDASTTIVDGGGHGSVFVISPKIHVTLSQLTIRDGGGGYADGGGILNEGTLAVNRSTIIANSAYLDGGGIFNKRTLTVNNSTISGNRTFTYGGGGGVANWGTLTVNRSTIIANSAYDGGGVLSTPGKVDTVAINDSTISGNGAEDGGGIYSDGRLTINSSTISGNGAPGGGGINGSGVTLQNSIIANNSGGNCAGTMTSNGYDLSSDNTCNFNGPGDMNNTDPKLGTLGWRGGPTRTIPLLEGSPAIDAGNPNGCTDGNGHLLKTDQRGYARPGKHKTDQRCDMGAFEKQTD